MESILNTIKKMLDVDVGCTHFDENIINHINTALMVLTQIGVGPEKGFSIRDAAAKWSDFLSDMSKLEGVKTYIYLRVKPLFDPTSSSAISGAMKNVADELEWRMNINAEEVADAADVLASLAEEIGIVDDDYDDYYDDYYDDP
ncbi:MAG: hypothetical protein IJZ39_07220 [Oscillospiraceae bacterium]|nr:hypothetical protein [Oscillospiraceae bacterium]